MSRSSQEFERDESGFADVEAAIFAARHLVVPTDDHRPRTLEAAREFCSDRRNGRKLRSFAFTFALFSLLTAPIADYLVALHSHQLAPSSVEMHRRAMQYAADVQIGPQWAMFEAYAELRRLQADRLGVSTVER